MTFRARILGAAAGGGLPQWNCGCDICDAARAGDIPAQTQSSLAVSANGADWAILNASPDIRQQIFDAPCLAPTGLRESPIKSVLLTNGDIDHIAGLLTLREMQPFALFATSEIHRILRENSIFNALNAAVVDRVTVRVGERFELARGVQASLFEVPGKVPLFAEGADTDIVTDLEGEQTVGVELEAGGRRAHYIPGCAKVTRKLFDRVDGTDTLFFDGTLWRDDEMIRAGLGQKTGQRMGHISMSGDDGSIAAWQTAKLGRRVFVHMNNTNPIWFPDGPERAEAEAAGWDVGFDGMELEI